MHDNLKKVNFKQFIGLIIAFITSMYFTYLISRVGEYNIISFLTIWVILFFGIKYLLNYSLKFLRESLSNKKKTKLIALSLFISLFIFLIGFKFFTYSYQNTQLIIKPSNNKQIIDSLVVNNVLYLYNGNNNFYSVNDTIPNKNISYIFYGNYYELNIKKSYNVIINFNGETEKATIHDGNKKADIIGYENSYTVTSNALFNYLSIIRCVCSLIFIFIIVFNIILAFYETQDKFLFGTIIGAFLIGLFYFLNSRLSILYPDSSTYIDFNFGEFFNLKFSGRTPIYPLVIRICQKLFFEHYLNFVCLFQYLIWFFSIIYLYKLLNLFIKSRKCTMVLALVYALSPTIVGWNNDILTESLALSGTLIFIYYIINYLKNNTTSSGIIAIILAFVLTFLRPTSLLLVAFVEIFLILRLIWERHNRKKDLKCLIANTISIFFIIIYAIIFHRTFGIYSISDAMVRQDLLVNIQEGYYKSSNDVDFIQKVDESLKNHPDNMWLAMSDVLYQYSLKEMQDINSYCRMKNLDKYFNYLTRLTREYASVRFEGYSFSAKNLNNYWLFINLWNGFSIINFGHVYILFLIQLLLAIFLWIKDKKVPWIYLGLFGFPCAIVYSSFIGTCNEFMRTAICCVPFTYISLCLLINILFRKEKND